MYHRHDELKPATRRQFKSFVKDFPLPKFTLNVKTKNGTPFDEEYLQELTETVNELGRSSEFLVSLVRTDFTGHTTLLLISSSRQHSPKTLARMILLAVSPVPLPAQLDHL
ncbi:hypothetical protein ROZALSC1DRAFT_25539 [Rozella allomycis CSF55]|uniref:Uncharacterized protein n=1 Tax=Rozella allomycis (strain CSF55) TaxID=988480 RepID=A0A4P9YAR7_ROZAC|nr:hypothetical protein ROZALSC1DRAFT_25539 [Rozella allomycis CSF55]